MDRSEEFRKIVNIYVLGNSNSSDNSHGHHAGISSGQSVAGLSSTHAFDLSPFMQVALRVSVSVKTNETLLSRMKKLAARKEFSNDPTAEVAEVSSSFQSKVYLIKQDLGILKSYSDHQGLKPNHAQHYSLMTQTLTKMLATQVQAFQSYAASHAQNLKERQQRVQRYTGQDTSAEAVTSMRVIEQQQQQYAMFGALSAPPPPPPLSSSSSSSSSSQQSVERIHGTESSQASLTRRRPAPGAVKSPYISSHDGSTASAAATSSSSGAGAALLQQQLVRNKALKEHRLSSTQKIEASLSQVGELFTQLTTLVMQQSETIARIEDDVEIGLEETKQANEHMQRFYEISKGNRSMILKIFALLVLFICLFLVWT